MDKVFQEGYLTSKRPLLVGHSMPATPGLHPMAPEGPGLCPLRHKEFNEFIKGKAPKEGIIIN